MPISFGQEDKNHIRHIFNEYERLLKTIPNFFIALIRRKGCYCDSTHKTFRSFDEIYEYRISNISFNGILSSPIKYNVVTEWCEDGLPVSCRIERNINIKDGQNTINSTLYRIPHSYTLQNKSDKRQYKYFLKNFTFDVNEIGLADITGIDMMIQHKSFIDKLKTPVKMYTLDSYLTDKLSHIILIIKNTNDGKIYNQLTNIIKGIDKHDMYGLDKIKILLNDVLSLNYNKDKVLVHFDSVLKFTKDKSWDGFNGYLHTLYMQEDDCIFSLEMDKPDKELDNITK